MTRKNFAKIIQKRILFFGIFKKIYWYLFQNVRLEETENGNHLVIGQATPDAEGVSWKIYDYQMIEIEMEFDSRKTCQ